MGMGTYTPSLIGSIVATEEGTYVIETASQTFGVDDFVYFDANGTIAICTTTSNRLNSAIGGLAGQKASGVTGNPVLVNRIRPDTVLRMSVFHTTPSLAVAGQAAMGGVYGVFNLVTAVPTGTGGIWAVDLINTATMEDTTHALAKVQVVGFYQGRVFTSASPSVEVDANYLTDIYGQVLVKVVSFTINTAGGGLIRNIQGP